MGMRPARRRRGWRVPVSSPRPIPTPPSYVATAINGSSTSTTATWSSLTSSASAISAWLLAHPGDEISAVELCGGASLDEAGHELLDRDALAAYRRRVEEIDRLLESAGRRGDAARVASLQRERDELRDALSAALARSGSSRRFVDCRRAGPHGRAQGADASHRRDRRLARRTRRRTARHHHHGPALRLPARPGALDAVGRCRRRVATGGRAVVTGVVRRAFEAAGGCRSTSAA